MPFETGLVRGAYLEAWAWNTSLSPLGIELPNWLIAIDGAVLALLAGLALGGKLEVVPKVYLGAASYALVHAVGALGTLLWAGSTIQLGLLFTTGGAVTILVAAIRMLQPREPKPIPPVARRTEKRRRRGTIAARWRRR